MQSAFLELIQSMHFHSSAQSNSSYNLKTRKPGHIWHN